ncbi:MAG: bifunctional ADP-dependent (S)-NAD(P)H-hydrate dehydratase/NAD(P)H-hydrate epimerase [Micropruina sp.]|nr:bifunctional ADP-dependent (S)-NAD(P)H-hydrate dehydratase/NAD(P)H-hydrate epimerase [Micropruina sp.]
MRPAYLASTIRAAEERALEVVAEGALMQRAAAGLATHLGRFLREQRGKAYAARVLFAVGSGNNGGDALYAAARLAARGVRVAAWLTSDRVHQGGWAAFRRAGGRRLTPVQAIAALPEVDLVVDGVLGIGGRAGLPDQVAVFASACRDLDVPVAAVDLPSGLDADSPGRGGGESFAARYTVTFAGLKLCHVLEPAASRCGRIEIVDIGVALPEPDVRCWGEADLAAHWPFPGASSDKYSRGVVGIDAGSATYPGAGVLVALGAANAGAGMVRFLGHEASADLIRHRLPNVVTAVGRVQAWVLGSGWGDRPDGAARVREAVATGLPVLIDADGLRHLPPDGLESALLTPHAGELAALLGVTRAEVETDPITAARAAASRWRTTVLLKGATQYVAERHGAISLALPGPAWTAQAGSGDVLAGICGSLLAAGLSPRQAALAGASVQALVARQHSGPFPPSRAVDDLPAWWLAFDLEVFDRSKLSCSCASRVRAAWSLALDRAKPYCAHTALLPL